MKWLVASAACWSLFSSVGAHIHSQKVRHFERESLTLETWLCALFSSALVGVCGVFPLLVNRWVRLDASCKDKLTFRVVLSFAVGGLLGDVFLHLLPEAYGTSSSQVGGGGGGGGSSHWLDVGIGLWVLAGLISFLVIEKVMKITEKEGEKEEEGMQVVGVREAGATTGQDLLRGNSNSNCSIASGSSNSSNGLVKRSISGQNGSSLRPATTNYNNAAAAGKEVLPPTTSRWFDKDISGYLNLVANSTDNFTHGLAIAASYVASPAVGMLTTMAILCHEIPHEIGDFAILLNSGFSLREAAKAQVLTASGGLVGVVAGLTAEHMSNASVWLLPFTAGGFLYIALVSIVPDLLECASLRGLLLQLAFLGLGVAVMALVTIVEKTSCGYMPPPPPLS